MSNEIKITFKDKSYVKFDSLTTRQLELLKNFQLIIDCSLDKKNSDKTVGFATKELIKTLHG